MFCPATTDRNRDIARHDPVSLNHRSGADGTICWPSRNGASEWAAKGLFGQTP
jgi:hypothetical protein